MFGVRYDDVLNVRSIPGLDGEIVATLDPLETGFLATGRHRLLPTSVWSELLVDGTTIGWVNRSFIGIAGMYTADVVSYSGASAAAKGETLEALAIAVAEAHVEVPEAVQRIELPVAPSDTGVWVDLVGIADDASAGYRMLIVPIETVDGWVVDRVDRIDFCSRGGSPGGLCV